jgi:hypothetical protein
MQKNEKSLGGGGDALADGVLGPGAAKGTLGLFLLPAGRPGRPAKKNPGGRTGYLENHWDSFFVSPKCGKRMDLTGFPNSNPRGLNLK